MRVLRRRGWAAGMAGMLVVLCGGIAQAQTEGSTMRPGRTLAVWTAFARNEPLKTRLGHTYDRDMYLVGLRWRWVLRGGPHVELAYTADLLPAVISTGMPDYAYEEVTPVCPPTQPCALPLYLTIREMNRQTAYGAGAAPVGLELRVRAAPPLAFLVRGSAGLVYFSRAVPDPAEQRLNFILDAGAAAEMRLSPRVGLMAGYRFSHLSNGGSGAVNPGMNSRMLELGLTFLRED